MNPKSPAAPAPIIKSIDPAPHSAMRTYVADPLPHVSPADAAHYLSVSEQTLAIWRCTKRYPLPYIKVGRLVRYRISDLDAFLKQRTILAQSNVQE